MTQKDMRKETNESQLDKKNTTNLQLKLIAIESRLYFCCKEKAKSRFRNSI